MYMHVYMYVHVCVFKPMGVGVWYANYYGNRTCSVKDIGFFSHLSAISTVASFPHLHFHTYIPSQFLTFHVLPFLFSLNLWYKSTCTSYSLLGIILMRCAKVEPVSKTGQFK